MKLRLPTRRKALLMLGGLITVLLVGYFLWPTPFRYFRTSEERERFTVVRTHRLTGATWRLTDSGWYLVDVDEAAPLSGLANQEQEELRRRQQEGEEMQRLIECTPRHGEDALSRYLRGCP